MKKDATSKKTMRWNLSLFVLFTTVFVSTVFLFQNCSDSRFATSDLSQVTEETILEAGLSRTISLSSKFNSEMNAQPVKIAIIVDNSNTMAGSQQNLARNLSSLFSEISKYDADVLVLSTSWRS